MKVVAGSASQPLGRALATRARADFLEVLFEKHKGGFPDGERYVRIMGEVRGEDVVLVQTTHPDNSIVELFLLQDALADEGAARVILVIPYFGYGRQDKKFEPGEPVSARALARRLQVQADEVLTVSVHDPRVLSYFEIPAREISGMPALVRYLRDQQVDFVLAPDDNARRFALEVGERLDVGWESLEKKRIDSYTVAVTPKSLDVSGRSVAIVDDVISTGTTIAKAAQIVRDQGASRVLAACVHGLFAGGAHERLRVCDEVVATDTISGPAAKVSVAPELAKAVHP